MNLNDTTVAAQGVDESIVLEHQPDAKQSDGNDTESVQSISDLEQGMELSGTVKSVTDFGAFVDLGVGPQGLVHISQLSRRRVEKVSDVVQVGDEVNVWIKKVDKKRGRISLTMVKPPTRHMRDLKPESVVSGVVTRIEPYGVFIDIGTGRDGMIHVSELADGYISSPGDVVSVGDKIDVKVLNVDRKARKVDLSTKDFITVAPPPEPEPAAQVAEEEKTIPTAMELAFQAALERDTTNKERGVERLISKRLRR